MTKQLTLTDIENLHEAAQAVLVELSRKVKQRAPAVTAILGKASNERFPLFSYVSFEDKKLPHLDPVVVGTDVRLDGDQWVIRTDICGEDTGELYLEPEYYHVPATGGDELLLQAVITQTQHLADRALLEIPRLFAKTEALRAPA